MPFREKLKKTFASKKSGSGDSTPSGTSPPLRKDIEYYKPHEIPKSKYRGRVDKDHQDKLEAYSFADAFQAAGRRASQALSGTFSPGGTGAQSAAQSRRSSWMSRTKSSFSTATSLGLDEDSVDHRQKSVAHAGAPKEGKVEENGEDDTDAFDVGLSRTATADGLNLPELRIEKTVTLGRPPSSPRDTLFTAEDLERAMTQASLRPRRGTVVAPAIQPEQIAVGA